MVSISDRKHQAQTLIISAVISLLIAALFIILLLRWLPFNFTDNKVGENKRYGFVLLIFFSYIILISLLLNLTSILLNRSSKMTININIFLNFFFIMINIILITMIFSFPNMRMNSCLIKKEDNCAINPGIKKDILADIKVEVIDTERKFSIRADVIKDEHKKAIDEIKARASIDNQWYEKKFILVGGLFAAFLAYSRFSEGTRKRSTWEYVIKDFSHLFKTILPSSALGMACIVSLAIDFHVRNNAIITRQLGLWIQTFIEPMISTGTGYVGWEEFLRIEGKRKIEGEEMSVYGLHMDYLFSIVDAFHFYFTSIYLYILYYGCLLFYFLNNKCKYFEFSTFLFIFALVHLTLAIFSFGGNSFPSTLEVQLTLWKGSWLPGDYAGWPPLAICMLVSGLAFMRLYTLHRGCGVAAHSLPTAPTRSARRRRRMGNLDDMVYDEP